jgi:hypothetical protein
MGEVVVAYLEELLRNSVSRTEGDHYNLSRYIWYVQSDSKGNLPNKNTLSLLFLNNYQLHAADEQTFAYRRISRILWDLRFHNPPTVFILSKINPVYVLPVYFLNIPFNIILKTMPTHCLCSLLP